MANLEPLNFSQPANELSEIADAQRRMLLPKNDFKNTKQYSSTSPEAMADGDDYGKGTGSFLDVYNQGAGAIQDIIERKSELVINEYQESKPYTTPSA